MKAFVTIVGVVVFSASVAGATISLPCSGTQAEAEAACKALAEGGHGVAVCGGIVALDVDARANAVCGKALAECEQGDIYLKLSLVEDACSQAQHLSAETTLACGDTSQSCGDTAQVCGDVEVSCPACPQCPDVQPACARVTYKYYKNGKIKQAKCRKWVVPVIDYKP